MGHLHHIGVRTKKLEKRNRPTKKTQKHKLKILNLSYKYGVPSNLSNFKVSNKNTHGKLFQKSKKAQPSTPHFHCPASPHLHLIELRTRPQFQSLVPWKIWMALLRLTKINRWQFLSRTSWLRFARLQLLERQKKTEILPGSLTGSRQ